MEILINKGANVNLSNYIDVTSMHVAAENGKSRMNSIENQPMQIVSLNIQYFIPKISICAPKMTKTL